MTISETILGVVPSKSNSYRIGNNRLFKTKAVMDYENKFYIQCRNRGAMITGYFEMEINVFYPNERADLDGSLKAVLDCLQKCKVIKDDRKCVKIIAVKYLDKINPRIELHITKVVNGL